MCLKFQCHVTRGSDCLNMFVRAQTGPGRHPAGPKILKVYISFIGSAGRVKPRVGAPVYKAEHAYARLSSSAPLFGCVYKKLCNGVSSSCQKKWFFGKSWWYWLVRIGTSTLIVALREFCAFYVCLKCNFMFHLFGLQLNVQVSHEARDWSSDNWPLKKKI